jgi:putative thioredoxin
VSETRDILTRFPASREYQNAQLLLPMVQALTDLEKEALPAITELDAAFSQSLRLVRRGKLAPALDGLLDILRHDRKYTDGRAHKLVLAILELMGDDDPQTRAYRQELASVLF